MITHYFDIETAYFNGNVLHDIYLKQPEGYVNENEDKVYKLLKNIYGLKQGTYEHNKKLNDLLISRRFNRQIHIFINACRIYYCNIFRKFSSI